MKSNCKIARSLLFCKVVPNKGYFVRYERSKENFNIKVFKPFRCSPRPGWRTAGRRPGKEWYRRRTEPPEDRAEQFRQPAKGLRDQQKGHQGILEEHRRVSSNRLFLSTFAHSAIWRRPETEMETVEADRVCAQICCRVATCRCFVRRESRDSKWLPSNTESSIARVNIRLARELPLASRVLFLSGDSRVPVR